MYGDYIVYTPGCLMTGRNRCFYAENVRRGHDVEPGSGTKRPRRGLGTFILLNSFLRIFTRNQLCAACLRTHGFATG